MVLGTGHGTACGVGALQHKPGWLGPRCLAEGLGLLWPGLAERPQGTRSMREGGVSGGGAPDLPLPGGDIIMGHQGHL